MYVDDLLSKVRENLDDCYDCGDAILSFFTPAVKCVFEWKEDNYSGSAFTVYFYKGKYFYLYDTFGSCDYCDEYMGNHYVYVEDIKDDIRHRTEFVDSIHEITFPYESDYRHPDLIHGWTTTLKDLGGDELYQRCYDLARERCAAFEKEHMRSKEKEQQEKAEKERAEKERIEAAVAAANAQSEQDARDLIAWFNKSNDDPFYEQKLASKHRQLQYYIRKIDDPVLSQQLTEIHTQYGHQTSKQ
jgi:hypothetical protein